MSANDGTSATRRDELLDLGHADRLALRPGRDLVDLVREPVEIVLADVLDQERARVRLGLHAGLPEALRDPGDPASLGDVVDRAGRRPSRTPSRSRASFFTSSPTSGEHGVRRRRREVRRRPPRRRPPSSLRSAGRFGSFLRPSTSVTTTSRRVAEQAARVAERDDVGAGRLERRDDLDRLGHEPRPQALHRRLDLGPVAARRSGRRASEAGRSLTALYRTRRSVRTVSARPSDSSTIAAALVGAVDARARARAERRQRVGPRVAVVVVGADGDHRDAWPEHRAARSASPDPTSRDGRP